MCVLCINNSAVFLCTGRWWWPPSWFLLSHKSLRLPYMTLNYSWICILRPRHLIDWIQVISRGRQVLIVINIIIGVYDVWCVIIQSVYNAPWMGMRWGGYVESVAHIWIERSWCWCELSCSGIGSWQITLPLNVASDEWVAKWTAIEYLWQELICWRRRWL